MATTATGGSLTAASPLLPFSVGDSGVVGVEVSGTWTGTITFEARIGNTWANAQVFTTAGVAAAATMTANGSRLINAAGFSEVRANFSTPTSGTPAVVFTGSPEVMGGSAGAVAATVPAGATGPFTFGGTYTGVQTNTKLITASAGQFVYLMRAGVRASKANSVNVAVRFGFHASATPAQALCVDGHPGVDPGGGFNSGSGAGVIARGGDGDDLHMDSTVATGGSIEVYGSYYLGTS